MGIAAQEFHGVGFGFCSMPLEEVPLWGLLLKSSEVLA